MKTDDSRAGRDAPPASFRYVPRVRTLETSRAFVAAASLALLACDSAPLAPVEPPGEAAPAVDEDLEDALDPPPSSAWPSEVSGLRDAVSAFTTVEECLVELRARTPTAVAEGVADLAYDGFFDDVCRGLDAVKSGSVEGCDALAISTARAGCRRRLALVHGEPRACPDDRVLPGREAVCVAWAARDADLCRASAEEARCRAVLADDDRGCRALRPGDRERCRAHVRRYASALGEERSESPAARAPRVMTLQVREGDRAPIAIERGVIDRGVRLAPQACRHALALANPLGELEVPVGLGDEEPSFTLELAIPAGREAPFDLALGATDALLSIRTPAHGGVTSFSGASGAVRVERFEPRLGGAIAGTITGTLRHADTELSVSGRFATFVRDLEPLPAHCAPRPQP